MARWDPKYRGFPESKHSEHTCNAQGIPVDRACVSYSNVCLPKKMLYGELKVGKQSYGGQIKWHKETLKVSLKSCDVHPYFLEEAVQVHANWHSLINTAVTVCEEHRVKEAIQKYQQQKSRASETSVPNPSQFLQCSQCKSLYGKNCTNQPSLHSQHEKQSVIGSHGQLPYQRMNCII